MNIEIDELKTLIPHKGKMMLLSRIIEYDTAGYIRSEFDITENCIFFDSSINGVPSYVGFEFMAQTISALSGIRDRVLGRKPKNGFILSVPSMKMEIPFFAEGSSADIRMKEHDRTGQVSTYAGEIFVKDKKVMEGKLMVMEIEDDQ